MGGAGAGSALRTGDVVAGATLGEMIAEGGGIRLWSAKLADGRSVVVVILLLDDAEIRAHFVAAAEEMKERGASLPGVLPVLAVDAARGAYLGDAEGQRTLMDIARIDWTQREVLVFMERLGAVVREMHEQGVVHGCLRPECVLVTPDSQPIVFNAKAFDIGEMCRTDPGAVALFATYSPPEQRFGRSASYQTDIFSLGRLFHLALMGEEPNEKDEDLPRLDVLDKKPNGIRRIVRACVAGDLDKRYDLVRELVEDIDRFRKHEPVGLPHPAFDKAAALERREKAREEAVKEGRIARGPEAIVVAEGPVEKMSQAKRVGLVVAGVLLIVVPTMIGYVTSVGSIFLSIATFFSIVPLGLASPGFGKPPLLGQVLVATAILGVLVFGDPARRAAELQAATSGFRADTLQERVAAVRVALADGETAIRQVNLDGADLSGTKMSKVELDGSSLRGANMRDVDLSQGSLWNVDVEGADFSGANLSGIIADAIINWRQAKCDERTTMPQGWECKDGRPAEAAPK
ncbi:MAG TPA: hypothetical protein ENK57_04790 [Polyangiaceae bacterium]|nr:hypothetical protein [Polyangiaceae bacterium]